CAGLAPRLDGSSQTLLRALSGIEIALWDLAGKLLGVPVVTLLGGRFRDQVRMYHDEGPRNMLEISVCTEWGEKMKKHSAGWTAFRVTPPRSNPRIDRARDRSNRLLTTKEVRD